MKKTQKQDDLHRAVGRPRMSPPAKSSFVVSHLRKVVYKKRKKLGLTLNSASKSSFDLDKDHGITVNSWWYMENGMYCDLDQLLLACRVLDIDFRRLLGEAQKEELAIKQTASTRKLKAEIEED